MSEVQWLSVAEVAERLLVEKDTVYAWITTRGLPAHRIGRFWRFDPREIDDWIRSGQAAEPPEITKRAAPIKKKAVASTTKPGRKKKA